MKLAIHHRPGSFSDRWITYCKRNRIAFKIVNAFHNDIINQVRDCDAFLWHHHHTIYQDTMVAQKILFALEHAGIKVFPNFQTSWFFDDKVAQKYLLESLKIPMVKSHIFYNKIDALNWVNKSEFPKVFKLKSGAGSTNVKLVKSKKMAKKMIRKAFGRGFSQFDSIENLRFKVQKYKDGKSGLKDIVKGMARIIIPTEYARRQKRENGYIYFQEFIPNLDSDIRIQVIGNRFCGLKRFTRPGDFRASGSGNFIEFDNNNIDRKVLELAVCISKKISSQSLTIDIIYNKLNPLVVELSYGFPVEFYDNCKGYWDDEYKWYEGKFIPQDWIIEDLIKT